MSRVQAVVTVLAKALADQPEAVQVTEGPHRKSTLVEVFAAPGDVGKMIGRQGRTVSALRTLAALAGETEDKTITLEVRDTPRGQA